MKKLIVLALLADAALLVACATSAPTFDSVTLAATNLDDAAIKTIGSMVSSGALNSAEAGKANAITAAVLAAISTANQANAAANSTTANATLAQVGSTITALTACLASGGSSTTIDNCISGVPAP